MPYEEEEDRGCEVKCPKGGGAVVEGKRLYYCLNLSCCFSLICLFGEGHLVVVDPPTGTDSFIRSYSTTAGSPYSPAVMQVCPPTGAMHA